MTRTWTLAALAALGICSTASAQQLELPKLSPAAKISQTVGLTEITIDYSSPAVRGRKIWGGLVPYDQVWRTGANAATKISFSKDVTLDGKPVPAGTYGLFTQPARSGAWTVILNKDPQWGSDYKKEADFLRVSVKPQPLAQPREHLAFFFDEFDDNHATIALEWEKVKLPIVVKTATDAQAQAAIKGLTENAWRQYNTAARYLLESKKDLARGLELAEKSIAEHEDWFNVWTKAQLLHAQGKVKEALAAAQHAKELGEKAANFFFKDEVLKALTDWKTKS